MSKGQVSMASIFLHDVCFLVKPVSKSLSVQDWEPLGSRMEFNTMYREHYCRQVPVMHQLRAKSASLSGNSAGGQSGHSSPDTRNKRPKTTNLGKNLAVLSYKVLMIFRVSTVFNNNKIVTKYAYSTTL